jgi:hypothetical protein
MVPKEVFWKIMEAYGAGIWPFQIVFYVAAILLVGWLFLKPGRISSLCAKLYLSLAFAWNGILFFLLLAKGMAGGSYGTYLNACLFLIVSALFAVDLFRQRMLFALPTGGWRRYATLVLILLVFCYPLFGMAFGHSSTSLILPGAFPCPTTALGLLLLTMALPQVDKIIYVVLLFCALPFTPFLQIARYGVYEDTTLFVTGIYSLALLVRYWKPEKLPT